MQQEVNVRVAVRVRPLLQKEKLVGEQMCLRVIPATNQLVFGKDKAFTFDHVLATKHTQGDVYEKTVEPLVKSCFEGYNATVFAYGQTGSGKTYTIGGCNLASITEEEMGIIPRAVKQMFDIMQSNHNREFIVRVSYIEIYKEELRDLLDMETSSKDLHIREDDKGNTLIMGASEWQCETLDEIMSCLEQGSAYRQTATTQMNDHSSRSHSVFTVLIEQRWSDCESDSGRRERKQSESSEIVEETGEIKHFMCAKFHFVDLAGSERAHRTGNVGDRFKESVHINSGLLALGNVISALGDPKKRGTHIPYRDSKITRLLKDSLGGNANTVMICCISPAASNFDESLNALKYANRARNIKNKPIVNRDVQSIRFEEMASEIKALREELQKQRSTMYTAGTTTTEGDVFERANQDAEHIRSLENKVTRLATECSHYHMIAEDAYRQLTDIRSKEILSRSQNSKLTDWLELMEEMRNKVPTTLNKAEWENETITKLESELKQCKKDLQSDEEIFADKNREVSALYQRIEDLEAANEELSAQLEEATERMKQQQEQLVEQKVQLEEMVSKLKESHETLNMSQALEVDPHQSQGALPSQRRAKSVPAHMLGKQNSQELHEPTPRNIHTSPALFSVDRVMQNFRARSQLLMDQLDDNDTVMQQHFSDGEAADDEDPQPSQRTFKRNSAQRGTYKINKPRNRPSVVPSSERRPSDEVDSKGLMKTRVINKGSEPVKPVIKVDEVPGYLPGDRHTGGMDSARLRCSTEIQKKRLKQTQIQVQQSTQKMRDLAINIKMKEQLIKELVKTGREAQQMNVQYEHKILELEKEKEKTKLELQGLQRAMTELAADKQHETVEKQKLQSEFQRKLEAAKNKMQALQAKQRETMKMANITSQNDKRIQELEMAVEKMRHQQDQLQKRLKDEVDRKVKLEREMQKEQQRIKELELRNEQQQKVLKVKTEEMAAVQRRLRTGVVGSAASRGVRTVSKSASVGYRSEDPLRLEAQKKWLDNEMEKVLRQREQAEALEQELKKREEILAKKEAMLGEKSELEMKKLRSSQVLNRDILTVSTKLESVERKLDEKREELVRTSCESVQDAVKKLQQNRDKLRKQRQVLDAKLHEGTVLSPQEERRLIELDEAIEALEAAMDYKNDSIYRQQEELRKSQMMNQMESGGLVNKLNALSAVETRAMLVKYFEKVIDLRDSERLKDLQCSELEMKLDEQERIVQDLEGALQHRTMETDRKLTQQQREYERQIQVLMHQISQTGEGTGGDDPAAELKVQQLEKDLYYYKKTSRELKKKLREVLTSIGVAGADGDKDLLADTPRTSTSGKIANGNNRDQATHSHSSPHLSQHPQNQGWVTERLDRGNRVNPNMPLSARTEKHNNMAANLNLPSRSENKDRNSNSSKGGRTGRSKEEGLYDLPSPRQTTPVKISRSSLRQMTEEEVSLRRSTASQNPLAATPRDSLEVGSKNPWT